MKRERVLAIANVGLGTLLFLGLWQAVGYYQLAGSAWPPLTDVLSYLLNPARHALYERAIAATLTAAGEGYLIGALIGIFLALIGDLFPPLRRGAARANAWIHAIPMIAAGPIFMLLLGNGTVPLAMAAFSVVFVFYVATISGFDRVSRSHTDIMTVLGASRWTRLVHLTIPAAMPAFATGIKLAVPRAALGAVLGEWFGAPRGLGVLMVTGMQEVQIPLLWSAGLLIAFWSLLFFALGAAFEHMVEAKFQ
jgi:ABC-type nitrate/sulfonate/bicarbonate transport system permease component